jgi:carbonic anhydrase
LIKISSFQAIEKLVMKPIVIAACLALYVCSAIAAEDGLAFCYKDEECGPSSSVWPELCHEGERQSPIELPADLRPTGTTLLRLIEAYKGDFFRLQNSGHSVSVDFVGESGENEGPTAETFSFPDPLNLKEKREYKFASLHFHWGTSDVTGSEHCIGDVCSAMEAHFVHHLAKYANMSEATTSGDENALTVLGVFINKSVLLSIIPGLSHPSLGPIVKNLNQVAHAAHDGGFTRVEEPIDFTQMIVTQFPVQAYSYKGSLTTPNCNEQVNWFVLKKPATVPEMDLAAFRTSLEDSTGEILDMNHRPVQPLNERRVVLNNAIPTF